MDISPQKLNLATHHGINEKAHTNERHCSKMNLKIHVHPARAEITRLIHVIRLEKKPIYMAKFLYFHLNHQKLGI